MHDVEQILAELSRLEPSWRLAYDCNPFAAAMDIFTTGEKAELRLPNDEGIWQLADDYEAMLREGDE